MFLALSFGVITVSPDGTQDFTTIQDAIDYVTANPSDTEINVYSGTYQENLLIEADMIISSVGDATNTIIDGNLGRSFGSTIVIRPQSGDPHQPIVEINGFGIKNGKGTAIVNNTITGHPTEKVGGGLLVYVNSPKVNNCKFLDNGDNSTNKGGAIFAASNGEDCDWSSRDDYVDSDELTPATGTLDFSNNTFLGNDADYGHSVYIIGSDYATVTMAGDILDVFSTEYNSVFEYWVASGYDIDYNESSGEAEALTNDVWVDPTNGINEGNTLGDQNNPFLTIDYALGMIYATEDHPINIYLAGETFSPATETFPVIMISNVNLIGSGEETTILNADGSEDNIRRVITMIGCNGNIVERLTITGGFAGGVTDYDSDNYEDDGGGLFLYSSHPRLENVKIVSNTASYSGGGMYVDKSNPTLINVSIKFNMSLYSGGVHITSSDPYFENVVISDNVAHAIAGGVYLYDSNPEIISVIVSQNTAILGAGMYLNFSDPTLINVTIVENLASSEMYPEYVAGGGIFLADSNPILTNAIIWDNMPESIAFADYSFIPSPTITYSDIEGGWEGEGNINADPLFTDSENGDYILMVGSPCIDAGTADIDGDGYDDITDYFGQAPDMGAYEFEGSALSGDLNSDGLLNILDVVVLVNIVLGGSEPIDAGDLNGDGILNILDVVMLVNIILNG